MPKQDHVPTPVDRRWLASFRCRVRAWYARNARVLPWRASRDAYAVWVSEIMLQQTQVETVRSYFERFMAAFPDVARLAAAREDDVLRLWEGLGYYRRARQMYQAAKIILRDHGGEFPRDPAAVRHLPGIGRYTAGAVLSIAFDAREPILEANTVRLLSRLVAFRGRTTTAAGSRLLWAMAEAVLPQKDAGTFNQALMELGSEVCLPKTPHCEKCPVATLCRAMAAGLQAEIPAASPKPAIEPRHEAAVIVRRRGRVLLRRCADGGRWAGLWDFPRFLLETGVQDVVAGQLRENLCRQTGVVAVPGEHLKRIKHSVTRFRITLDCFAARWQSGPNGAADNGNLRWVRPDELPDYPLSTTGRKLARLAEAIGD